MTVFALSSTQSNAATFEQFENSIGMVFITVPAGEFLMGSADNDLDAYEVEKPQHKVVLTKPFSIATTEVTQEQWETVMGSNPYTLDRSNPYYHLPGMKKRITKPTNPATVSWEDAQEFIHQLNQREGVNAYRLPTEAEWEYAARAGTQTAYSFGNDSSQLTEYAWYGENFISGGSHMVGTKKPNPWGLYDVHGNVWEWVQDWYSDHYETSNEVIDPVGPATGENRVVRGGSWHVTATSWRSAFRKPYASDYRGISIGFRVVRDVDGTAVLLEEFGKIIGEGGSGITISSQSGHRLGNIPEEESELLAMTATEELLELPLIKNITDTLKAYQYSKRCNGLRVMYEATAWAKRGATLNSISPGIIITPLANDELKGPRGEGYRKMLASSPAGRAGTPDEVGDLAEFLMRSKGRFITGSDFLIDGGTTASYWYGDLQYLKQTH